MACLLQRKVVNPHYKKIHPDRHYVLFGHKDDYLVPVDCGVCVNCVNKYKSSWKFRLVKEFEYYTIDQLKKSYYVTLTMSPKYYGETKQHIAILLRRFFERVRKHTKRSPRHFFISERGEDDNGEHRIHLHGFLFNINFDPRYIWRWWNYGFVKVKPCLNPEESLLEFISYCTGYITKDVSDCIVDKFDKPFVFCSPALGRSYADDVKNINFHHQNNQFIPFVLEDNLIRSLPRYLRNKIFTEDERKSMSNQFFKELSDDVIPPPPYYIGSQQFTDYSAYLENLKPIQNLYNKIYGNKFSKSLYGLVQSESSSCELGQGLP